MGAVKPLLSSYVSMKSLKKWLILTPNFDALMEEMEQKLQAEIDLLNAGISTHSSSRRWIALCCPADQLVECPFR